MRIVFIGSSGFGLKCLKSILSLKGVEISGIISNKKKFNISYSKKPVTNVLHAEFGDFAKKNKIPFYEMEHNLKEKGLSAFLQRVKPELIVVVGWYHMIPDFILAKIPCAGLHASLLPKYRGGAPLVWAIINGEKETGITFFLLDKGVDSGPIIGQEKVKINKRDTIATVYKKIEKKGIKLLRKYLPKIANRTAVYKKQDESQKTIFPQRTPEDGRINWNWGAKRIKDFIRAQTKPYPGAYTIIKNKKVVIWDADITKRDI